jgi:hypothetical protein
MHSAGRILPGRAWVIGEFVAEATDISHPAVRRSAVLLGEVTAFLAEILIED